MYRLKNQLDGCSLSSGSLLSESRLPKVLREDFAANGFTAVGQRAQSDIPYRKVAPKGLDSLLALYNKVDWAWEKIGFGRWFGTFVVTWGRKS